MTSEEINERKRKGEIREGSERVGFQVVTLDGRRGPLASSKNSSSESIIWPSVGRYKIDIKSFESLALPELQVKPLPLSMLQLYKLLSNSIMRCRTQVTRRLRKQIKDNTDLFIIDEVGKMELFSSAFFPNVLKILESNIPLLASIPIPKSGCDLPGGIYACS
ncbi:hypothetical protein GIB67_030051 [Kingdonia uniflora]|uniref:Uncharacterized protein n=1 Tax=Kingdonia uniflora TaxID=39325 RepID=A0A7J7MY21_9MAGN|nr:hypothetical protein GIB67_030051 [Kingdonia uniflora]